MLRPLLDGVDVLILDVGRMSVTRRLEHDRVSAFSAMVGSPIAVGIKRAPDRNFLAIVRLELRERHDRRHPFHGMPGRTTRRVEKGFSAPNQSGRAAPRM